MSDRHDNRRPQFREIHQYIHNPGRHKPTCREERDRARDFTAYRRSRLRHSKGCEFRESGRRCGTFPVTLHHRAGREGENLFRLTMTICRHHHDWIHANQEQSRELGYIIDPPDAIATDDDPIFRPVPPREVRA